MRGKDGLLAQRLVARLSKLGETFLLLASSYRLWSRLVRGRRRRVDTRI